MEEPRRLLLAKHVDHPLDLSPPAKMDDVADVAAAAGAERRLRSRIGPEAGDQVRGVGEGGAVGEMDVMAQFSPEARLCSGCPV